MRLFKDMRFTFTLIAATVLLAACGTGPSTGTYVERASQPWLNGDNAVVVVFVIGAAVAGIVTSVVNAVARVRVAKYTGQVPASSEDDD